MEPINYNDDNSIGKIICQFCKKQYSNTSTFNRHLNGNVACTNFFLSHGCSMVAGKSRMANLNGNSDAYIVSGNTLAVASSMALWLVILVYDMKLSKYTNCLVMTYQNVLSTTRNGELAGSKPMRN